MSQRDLIAENIPACDLLLTGGSVVGMLALFAVFFVIFRPDYQRFGNGYDVRVLSTGSAGLELPEAVRADVVRSITIPTRGYIGPVGCTDRCIDVRSPAARRLFLPPSPRPAWLRCQALQRVPGGRGSSRLRCRTPSFAYRSAVVASTMPLF